jgi:hypothetical protein
VNGEGRRNMGRSNPLQQKYYSNTFLRPCPGMFEALEVAYTEETRPNQRFVDGVLSTWPSFGGPMLLFGPRNLPSLQRFDGLRMLLFFESLRVHIVGHRRQLRTGSYCL